MTAWQSSNSRQQKDLIDELARVVQNISETDAQELPDKDPDVPGIHDKLHSLLTC